MLVGRCLLSLLSVLAVLLPRSDSRRTLRAFRSLGVGDSYDEVLAWVGAADADIGSSCTACP